MLFMQHQVMSYGVTQKNSKISDMNHFPLTPPMDSPDSLISPASPSEAYANSEYILGYAGDRDARAKRGNGAYLTIIEEPIEKFRFRYKSEMAGTHGSLTGRNSDRARKQTYPTVKLENYKKPAVIRCSLYQWSSRDMDYLRMPHAHRLVKRAGLDEVDDPHDIEIGPETNFIANFHSMGIIHTAKKFIVQELVRKNSRLKREANARLSGHNQMLTKKEEYDVKAFAEKESKTINLNIVCLRYDAFEVVNNIYYPLCDPIYSSAINNLKSALTGDLKIVRMDHCTSSCKGGREIFIFVEKVTKKNVKIRFYELDGNDEVWSNYGRFSDLDVHHQYAIAFKTPPYRSTEIEQQVKVFIELERPSDGARSEPKEFIYTPCEIAIGKKRTRLMSSFSSNEYSSNELPATINTSSGFINDDVLNVNYEVTSDELTHALTKGTDSEEFKDLCNLMFQPNSIIPDFYENNMDVTFQESVSLRVDGPSNVDFRPPIKNYREQCIPQTLNAPERLIIQKIQTELVMFLKTNPNRQRLYRMFGTFFSKDEYVSEEGNTILHLLILENNPSDAFLKLFLNILLNFKCGSIINQQNCRRKTALHLAVENHNVLAVDLLLSEADVSIEDDEGNTAVHLAIISNAPTEILKLLLQHEKVINQPNFDSLAPLHLAVKHNNLPAAKLLWLRNADVNLSDKKNGHTSLHMAVQDENIEMVNFLLGISELEPNKLDFNQHSAFKLAQKSANKDRPKSLQIYNIITTYMEQNGTFIEVDIKEETQDSSDEESMDYKDDTLVDIKSEPLSPSSLRQKYNQVKNFTDECKNSVCEILDKSGTWQNLADLLDHGDLMKTTNLFSSTSMPSKILLTYAIASGDTVLQIRDFLEHLDELEAVEVIDKMVKEKL